MRRTTEQWEALLNDTTPGPWRLSASEGVVGLSAYEWDETPRELANIRLASTAPEAVAEVVRLRREVAEFRDQMTKSSEEHKAMYDRGRNLDHLLAADYDDQIAYALTRILEGGNDE